MAKWLHPEEGASAPCVAAPQSFMTYQQFDGHKINWNQNNFLSLIEIFVKSNKKITASINGKLYYYTWLTGICRIFVWAILAWDSPQLNKKLLKGWVVMMV